MRVLNSKEKKNNIVTCNHCESELEFDKKDVTRAKDSFGIEYEDYIICPTCCNVIIVGYGNLD